MRCWARALFKSAKADEWRIVDVPFEVTEPTVIEWPNRMGKGTQFESRMEYRPLDDPPKKARSDPRWADQAWENPWET